MKIAQLLVDLSFVKTINEQMESHGSFMWLSIFSRMMEKFTKIAPLE